MREVEDLQREWHTCERCELCKSRTRVVHGAGKVSPTSILVVGEAPGENEDAQGQPFVGDAGLKLLELFMYVSHDDRLIQICESDNENVSIDLADLREVLFRTEELFLDNVLACRPPGNADPTKPQLTACWARLEELIYILDPLLIITAGNFALQVVTGRLGKSSKGAGIQASRGTLHSCVVRGRLCETVTYPVLPILHPSFLLRQPDFMIKNGWADKTQKDLLRAVTIVDLLKNHYYGEELPLRINRSPFPPQEDQMKARRRAR